jgi:hypothetical protein
VKGPILPWLRSIDGLNTHDDGYESAMAGGVTSVQVLPGSNNAIGKKFNDCVHEVGLTGAHLLIFTGGQSFFVKLRKPKDRSASSMVIEPPYNLNLPSQGANKFTPFRWRHMK